jgi:hypothetical protein
MYSVAVEAGEIEDEIGMVDFSKTSYLECSIAQISCQIN